jgi:tetratricopeptide (TPR) repeat protein
MRKTKFWLVLTFAAVVSAALPAMAQQTAKIHGHVQDPAGVALKGGTVSLSDDGGKTSKYSFKTDDNGNYTGDGIAPGTYSIIYRNADTPPDKIVDEFNEVKIAAGADITQDFDMSRPEYLSKLSPEQKKALEDIKAKNAEVLKENSQIKNLNADLIKARQDNKDKNYTEAESLMTRDTQAKPDAGVLWVELGVAQKGLKKYDDAVTSLKKAVELEAASKKPNPEIQAAANDALGEVYATQGKVPEAQAAYDAAVQADPKGAAVHYTNEAIMMDRANQIDATVAAADKAIAADPTKAIAYYLKGKALINKASVDPKTGKIVAPPGCAEAYQKYLQLAPDGQFSADAKAVLAEMSTTVTSSYKGKK